MARALADIEEDIVALSDKERAELLGKLIAGLDAGGGGRFGGGLAQGIGAAASMRSKDGTARTFPADDVVKEASRRA